MSIIVTKAMNKSRLIGCVLFVGMLNLCVDVDAEPADIHIDPEGKNQVASLRKGTALNNENPNPAVLQDEQNKDLRFKRAYPMQPPPIPHKITAYQIDLNANKCMSCHARTRTEDSQAPMISVTHFMDREGNFLADVSARRYFCTQCHVPQVERDALIENTFKDVHQMIVKQQEAEE